MKTIKTSVTTYEGVGFDVKLKSVGGVCVTLIMLSLTSLIVTACISFDRLIFLWGFK